MSKPWPPRTFRTPARGRRARRTKPFSWAEAGLVVLGGCVAGLIYAGIGEHAPPEPEAAISVPVETETAEVTDPWAESRRSALILQAQEGSPGANPLTRRDRGAGVRPGSATTRVVDGDTFWYGGEKIRIADIDTPEIRGRCAYESRLAARATERMGELLEAGPFELQPIPGRDEDRYGRKLRVVTRGSRSLGDQLVAEGLARTWTGRREPWCA